MSLLKLYYCDCIGGGEALNSCLVSSSVHDKNFSTTCIKFLNLVWLMPYWHACALLYFCNAQLKLSLVGEWMVEFD